jgi:MFS superfamily sulfate permease-like transporter
LTVTSASQWMPGLAMIQRYDRSWLRHDLVAGLVLTAVLIPAGIGYAGASGLPAVTGLYATIVPLLAYALVGPSRLLVLGPDSALAPIIAASVVPLAAGDPDRAVALAGLLALMMGLLLLLGGILRLGFVTDLLSKPIRLGYLNGVALVVVVGQLPKLFGFSVDDGSTIDDLRDWSRSWVSAWCGIARVGSSLSWWSRWWQSPSEAGPTTSRSSGRFRRDCPHQRWVGSRGTTLGRSWVRRSVSHSSRSPTRA